MVQLHGTATVYGLSLLLKASRDIDALENSNIVDKFYRSCQGLQFPSDFSLYRPLHLNFRVITTNPFFGV